MRICPVISIMLASGLLARVATGQEAKSDGAPAAPLVAAAAAANPAPPAAAPAASPAPVVAAPALAKADPNARNIRFQFEGIPYSDVVERFAQMANRPLLSNTNIQGTLTYNDPNSYSYGEALDTLNTILAMKGVTLVEAGNNLQLVPFKDIPTLPHKIMRGMDHAGDVRPGEIITVVLDVKNLDPREVADSVSKLLSNAGAVAPLSKGRGMIVTDHLANIQRIRTLMAAIDIESAVNRQMKTYTLLHASGAIVSDLLNRTFGVATAPKRTQFNANTKALDVLPPDPNDYVTSVYDDASRTLVLFGPPERLELADELISKFEQKEGGGGDVRIYFPQSLKADELAGIIRQAIPGVAGQNETAANAATKARVIADNAQNRLIVAAPIPGQLEQIDQLIGRLDKGAGAESGRNSVPLRSQTVQLTKVFRPRSTESTNVASILRQALTRRNPGGQVVSTASISYDAASQSVVVSGSPADLQIASDIVTQLETGSSQPTVLKTRFIEVDSVVEAKRLQPLVEQLYRSQMSGAGETVAHAKIMADTETGRLIVTASEDHLGRIEELVKQLRADRPVAERKLKILALQNTRVDTVVKTITDLVTEKMSDRRFAGLPKPSINADSANNRLLVTATDDEAREIESIVKLIDVAPEKASREVRMVAVTAKTPAEIIPLVTQVLDQTGAQSLSPQSAPKLMPDPSGKQIIVLALPADLERVQKLIQSFDQTAASGAARQTRSVQLYSRNATELTPLVTQLYSEQIKGQIEPSGGPATVLAESRNNRVMVSGSEKEIARVEAIIRQLDPEGKPGAKDETRVVRLKNASAAEIAGLVEKSLNLQQQKVRVLTDTRSNSLVVSGDADSVKAAVEIIDQLDTRPNTQAKELRIFELKSADASVMTPMVNSLFTEMLRDQRGAEYVSPTKIVPDSAGNRVIVTGLHDEIEQIAQLVQRLDQAPEQAPGARVFKLNSGDARMLAPIVSGALIRFDARGLPLRKVTVTADEKTNSLIVSGSRTDLQDAASVIEKLDDEGTTKSGLLRMIDVRSSDVDGLAALATKVFAAQNPTRNVASLVTITPDAAGHRLMVLAPPNMVAQVEELVKALDANSDQAQRKLHMVEVKNASAAEILPKVNQIYAEQSQGKSVKPATVYADASGTRLSVFGTKEQAAAIQQIVETLGSQQRPARETKVFDLGKSTEAQRILPLAQQLYKDQLAGNPQLGTADAQFISDGRTGRIVVSARADQLTTITEIFARFTMEGASSQPARETRTIEVGTAGEVTRILPLVQQLYRDQWKERSEVDPADAQILPDARSGRLIVTGKPEHLKAIQTLVEQLGGGKARTESRETRVYDLSTASAVELATTVRTLYLEESKVRLGGQPADTLILPDGSANRLIVTGDTNELQVIEETIKKLDKVSAQSASARVFKLKSADPAKVSEILSTALVRYDAYGRPQKRVSVVVDAATRTLIATGDARELQGISVIVEQLDSSLGTQQPRQMKVLQVKTGRVGELSARVRQLYNDQVKNQPDLGLADALILEDTASNQLILAGSEEQLKLIERITRELQSSQLSQESRATKIIDLPQGEDPSRLLSLVQGLYQEHWKTKDPSDPADAQIVPDAKNSRLLVTGRTNHLAEITAIIAQLSAPSPESTTRETKVYDLTTATAPELASTVTALYQEEVKSRAVPPAAQARVLPDRAANRLIISGGTNELARVEEIIRKLDDVTAKAGNTRVFKLKHASSEQVATVVSTALVQITPYGTRVPRVSVGSDKANNILVINGEPKDLQAAGVIVEQMDGVATAERRELRIIPVAAGGAASMAQRVTKLYEDQLKGRNGDGAADALILGDEVSSRLIVTATESHLKLIEETVKQLQEGGGAGQRQVRLLPVENNSASSIAALVRQLFPKQVASTEPGNHLVVTALADDRTVLVETAGETLDRVQELVKTLDGNQPAKNEVMHTVHLSKGRAEDLAQAVNTAIASRKMNTVAQQVKVTPVVGANTLLINGPNEPVAEVIKIIKELDQESSGGDIEVRMYKLENGTAKEVSSVLQQLLQNVSRQLRQESGRFIPATVNVIDRSNSLMISGTPAHFKAVEKILPTLDKAPERSDRDVQFVWLRKAKAYDVVSKLESVFSARDREDRPLIEADPMNNSLTVIAKRGDMKEVQDLVGRLDDSAKDSSMQVRLRTVETVGAEQMARMLQNIYPQMASAKLRVVDKVPPPLRDTNAPSASPTAPKSADTNAPANPPAAAAQPEVSAPEVVVAVDKDANALILSGPAQELDSIDRLITDLSFSFSGNEAEFRVYSLRNADPVVVARILSDLLKPEPVQLPPGQQRLRVQQERPRITIVPEPRTRGVVVRARPTDFALLESIIKQIDSAGELSQTDFKLITLTNAPPNRVLPLVQQMVTQMNAARPGEQVSVTADARSRGLFVVAHKNSIEQLEKLIYSLDTRSKNPEAEVLVVQLRNANAAQLAQVLQTMMRPGVNGESTAENRELQEQVRRLKVRNSKGEAVSLDLAAPTKISAEAGGAENGNRLVLTSTPDNLDALEAIVGMLDQTGLTDGVSVKLVPLENADAATVSQTLTTIFNQGQRLATGPGGKAQPEGETGKALTNPLNIAVDQRSNTVILTGRDESLELALRVIGDLDKKVERFVTEVKLIRLKHATASRLIPMLQAVFAEGPAAPGSEGLSRQVTRLRTLKDPNAPKLSTDSRARAALVIQAEELSNTLVIAARADTLPLIEDVIDQLDIPAASGLETVRIYPLLHADPVTMLKIVNDMYTGPRAATLRAEDKPIVSLDPRTSSLIVAGNSKSFGVIEGLFKQLDRELPFDLRDIRILPLEFADASVLSGTLQRILDARLTQRASLNAGTVDTLKVIVLADDRSNSLLVGGSKDSFELVQTLVKQLDKASTSVSGQIRLIPMEVADARSIASTLTTLFAQRYAAARGADVQRNKPIILPDPRSNSLMVAAGVEDNATIDDLIRKLDRKMENPSLVLTVIPLKHNDATRVSSLVEGIFAARLKAQTLPGQPPQPGQEIKLEPDAINNALIVSASKENLQQINELLEKIDVEPVVAGGLLQIFSLQYADAQRVASILRSLVSQGLYRPGLPQGSSQSRSGRDALAVSVDQRSNSLMISASPENLAIAKEIILNVDTKDYNEATDVHPYTLRNARASSIATTLTQFFQAKRTADATALNASERSVPVTIIPDDRTNTILVTGGKEAFATVERLLQQLDGEGIFSRVNFRVFPLKNATAIKLQPTLQQIFANRPSKVKGEPVEPITVVADAWVNALLVGAAVDDMSTVEGLIQRLDSDQGGPGIAIQVFQLAKADARKVAQTVTTLYRQGSPGSAFPINVTADDRMNAIVVSAGEADTKRIGELVKKLDTDQVARVSEIKVFPLRYARAESLGSILNTALNTKPSPLGDENPNAQSVLQFITRSDEGKELVTAALKEGVLITPDGRMNSLIVSGPVDYMGLIEQIITRMDANSPQQAKIKVFTLQNADARQMSELLMNMFRMSAVPGSGTQRSIQYTLVRADASPEGGPEQEVATATLGTAEQNALTVTVDYRTNSLLVGGTEHYVALVSEVIDSLDSSPANERKTEVVRLKNSQALDVATAIRNFLDQEQQRVNRVLGAAAVGTTQRILEREVAVVAEPLSNTLLVSANPRYFGQIKEVIDELDKPQPQVMIQVLLAEVTLDALTDLGFEWAYSGKKGDVAYGIGTDFNVKEDLASMGGFSSAVTGTDFNFLLRALKNEGRLEVLSRPEIVTADNKPASINVGQRVPLITDSRVTPQGDTINSFAYQDIGVNLTVTPKISPDGFVKMEIGTTNSSLSSSTVQINKSATVPIINQRRANTTVSVLSGQTVIIGGLIETQDDKRVIKIPWLGDIPYLGALFRSTHNTRDRKELLVLLTPQVLEQSAMPPKLKAIDEMTRERLDKSRIKDELRRDAVQKQILDPLFPEETFKSKPTAQPKADK